MRKLLVSFGIGLFGATLLAGVAAMWLGLLDLVYDLGGLRGIGALFFTLATLGIAVAVYMSSEAE